MIYWLLPLILLLFLLPACGGKKRIIYPVSKVRPMPYPVGSLPKETQHHYLEAVNAMRENPRYCGTRFYASAQPLVWNEALYKASYEHSRDMAITQTMSHPGSGTQSDWTVAQQRLNRPSRFSERIENNGYVRYKGIAENIAYGARVLNHVMQQWINSEGHCRNIMNPIYNELGMAEVKSADGVPYWTQNFGSSQ